MKKLFIVRHTTKQIETQNEYDYDTELSKEGISSITYNRKDLDCSLGMLSTLLTTMYKIRVDNEKSTHETITFTWI